LRLFFGRDRLFLGSFDLRLSLHRNFFDHRPGYRGFLDGQRLLDCRLRNFSLGVWYLRLRNFDSTGAATDNVSADPALHNRFTRLSQVLVFRLYDAVGDNFFFTDVDLRLR
jgi:hypothetical protein